MLADSKPGIELVGEAGTAAETLSLVGDASPDIVILDLWLGDDDGLDILPEIRSTAESTKVLVYSMNDELQYGPRCVKAGADGYLMKDRGLEELSVAIEVIESGERYLSPKLKEALVDIAILGREERQDDEPALIQSLTDRELHIFRLIGRGLPTGKIADKLNISPRTVGAHRENIKNKLGADSSAGVARLAVTYVENHTL